MHMYHVYAVRDPPPQHIDRGDQHGVAKLHQIAEQTISTRRAREAKRAHAIQCFPPCLIGPLGADDRDYITCPSQGFRLVPYPWIKGISIVFDNHDDAW